MTLYKVFIKSKLQYGILVYGSTSLGTLYPLFCVQKRILRIIDNKPRGYPSASLFEDSGILSIYNLYVYELFKFVIKANSCTPVHTQFYAIAIA